MLTDFLLRIDDYPEDLTLCEAAELTGYSTYVLRSAIRTGVLSYYRLGHQYIIPKLSLRNYVLQQMYISPTDDALWAIACGQADERSENQK